MFFVGWGNISGAFFSLIQWETMGQNHHKNGKYKFMNE
jgi:hypothetical protein